MTETQTERVDSSIRCSPHRAQGINATQTKISKIKIKIKIVVVCICDDVAETEIPNPNGIESQDGRQAVWIRKAGEKKMEVDKSNKLQMDRQIHR